MHTLSIGLRRNSLMQILPRHWHLLLVFALAAGLSACGSDVNTTSNGTQTSSASSTSTASSPTVGVSSATSSTAPTVAISAEPSIVASGGSTTLTWTSTGATACTASGAWSGTEAVSGTRSTGALSADATYTLNCTGPGGNTQQSTTVTISAPVALACSGSSGPLTLKVSTVRSTGISPFLMFFDATATTDTSITGNATTFQNVTYTWNFGDFGASGTGTWAYGANAGHNSKNTATGGIAAHLYITPGTDTAYTATVTATDGTNKTSCQLGVTAYDPEGTHGFAGAKTTCVSAPGTPVPGSGDCPAGAAVLSTSSFNTALGSSHFGSGKRVLFKCGDTFSGDNVTLTATTASIGAYGGCEGTQTNQPILSDTTAGNPQLNINAGSGDIRISNIYFNGHNAGGELHGAVTTQAFVTQDIPYQITLWNLQATGDSFGYSWTEGAQWGLIGTTTLNATGIAVFVNQDENNPAQMRGTVPNINYQALLGNFVNGVGAAGGSGAGIEAMRTSACRMCVFENNTIENANTGGGVFKLHNGNTYQSCGGGATGGSCQVPCTISSTFATTTCWTGVYTELVEISDNLFTGNSGGVLSDIAPQNGSVDERLRNIVIERNLYSATTGGQGDTLLLVTGANMTVRDNVFYMPGTSLLHAGSGVIVAQRGSGNKQTVQYNEAYNNTCYAPNSQPHQQCIGFDTSGDTVTPTANSFASNNMFYVPTTTTGPTVHNTGTGNTVSNNTATVTNNPGFTDGSGDFSLISDFKPTENDTGGTSVPVWYDALDVA